MKIELTKEQYLAMDDDQRLNAFFGLMHINDKLNTEIKELRELHDLKTKIDYVPSSE